MFLPDPSARVITCIHVLFFKFDNDITPYMLNIVIIIYVRMCVFMTCVTMQKTNQHAGNCEIRWSVLYHMFHNNSTLHPAIQFQYCDNQTC